MDYSLANAIRKANREPHIKGVINGVFDRRTGKYWINLDFRGHSGLICHAHPEKAIDILKRICEQQKPFTAS